MLQLKGFSKGKRFFAKFPKPMKPTLELNKEYAFPFPLIPYPAFP